MKKIAFTLYVVALLVMFPLVAVLEMDHGINTPPNVENISISAYENVSGHDIVTLQILLSQHFNEQQNKPKQFSNTSNTDYKK